MSKPKVFISYSHDSQEHKDRVLALSDRLNEDGIDCRIDQYEQSPPEGWPRWMLNKIDEADFVVVVCTENYDNRFRGKAKLGKGKGGKWEGAIITQELYVDRVSNAFASGQFGKAMTSGDFNGDGHLDLVVGAPSYRNPSSWRSGAIFVNYGGTRTLNRWMRQTIFHQDLTGTFSHNDRFGSGLAGNRAMLSGPPWWYWFLRRR